MQDFELYKEAVVPMSSFIIMQLGFPFLMVQCYNCIVFLAIGIWCQLEEGLMQIQNSLSNMCDQQLAKIIHWDCYNSTDSLHAWHCDRLSTFFDRLHVACCGQEHAKHWVQGGQTLNCIAKQPNQKLNSQEGLSGQLLRVILRASAPNRWSVSPILDLQNHCK